MNAWVFARQKLTLGADPQEQSILFITQVLSLEAEAHILGLSHLLVSTMNNLASVLPSLGF